MEERRRDTDVQIEVLTERVENWMNTTTEYRLSLCSKLDKIQQQLHDLPCPARIEQTNGIKTQLKALWVLVSATLVGIIGEWLKLK